MAPVETSTTPSLASSDIRYSGLWNYNIMPLAGCQGIFPSLHASLKLQLKVPLHLSLLVLLRDVLPLVVELLAPRQAHLDLHQASLKVDLQRHQRVALLRHLGLQLPDLHLVKQKLSHTQRILVENISLLVGLMCIP